MTNNAVSAPRCFLDVYPYEGGKFTVSNNTAAYLQLSTSKTIVNGGNGTFTLNLAPGGPYGLNARPTWNDIFTPFSLVVIGMQRGQYINITMIGMVVSTDERMERTRDGVSRSIQVHGEDFTRMFTSFCYYNLNLQIGLDNGILGVLGLPSTVSNALSGSPDQVGSAWYNKIMAGPGSLMEKTSFAYKGQRPSFFDFMSTWFEPYPGPVDIPTLAPFIGDEGTWLNKFMTFFPYPWYEFFIQTAPIGYYAESTAASQPISMDNYPNASPTLVARVNPFPFLNASGSTGSPTYSMDLTRWYALPQFGMDGGHGTINQDLGYSEVEVRNYYVFMPTWLLTAFGQSNGSITPFQLLYSAWCDPASIHRYGYRPQVSEVRWMADPGAYAQGLALTDTGNSDFADLVQQLSLRPVSYYEPTPNMLRGAVQMELRPDILPGNRFTFAPYRDGVKWTFYIEGVSHNIPFSGRSTTTLTLSRGLLYEDYYNNDLLVALHTGNAQRINGQLQIGLPTGIGNSLTPLNLDTIQGALGGISRLFGTPSGYSGP